ncbi:MAG: DMT family transporter [Rhodocyclaceae bacterium]|nr:DMT family transporter [Rhodocyclaceae bacterium]
MSWPLSHRHFLRGVALMMTAVLMFSAMDTLAKLTVRGYPLGSLIWFRYTIHLAFMLLLLAPRMGLDLVKTRRPWLQLLRGALLVGSTAFFYLSLRYLPLTEAAAISFIGPVLTTVLSGPLLGERVSRRQWAAVSLGFAGVLVIVRPGGGVFAAEGAFPLATALCFSLYQIVTRKVAGRENPMTTLFYTALVGAGLTSLALPFTWQAPAPAQFSMMVAIGLLGGAGHFLLIRAVSHASPMALAPFAYSQLVWSTLLGWIAFGDFPGRGSLLGMLIVIAAGLLAVNWRHMRRRNDAIDQVQEH